MMALKIILKEILKVYFRLIIKLLTKFIEKIFRDSTKVKRIGNYVTKYNLYLYFLMKQNLLTSSEKMRTSAELRGCVTLFIYFLHLL